MSATPVTIPDAPSSVDLVPIDGGFRVDFTAAGNGGSAILFYYYRVTATGSTPLGPWLRAAWTSGTTFTIAGLTNGSSYDVDIRAVNAVGFSEALLGPSSTPGAKPAAPAISNVIAGDSKISIVITPGNNGGYAISKYSYSINGGTTWITPSPNPLTNPIVVTGLTNGTSYQVRVRTFNEIGDSDPSAISVATPATSSAAPAITAVTPADGSLSVAFNAPTNTGGSAITTYEYSIDGGTLWKSRGAASAASPLVITGVRNGAAYPIKIRAITAIAQGAASATTLAIPQVPGAGKPTNVIATPLNGAALVSWRAPEGWVGDPIASYRVNASPGSATCTWSSGPSSCQVDGLTNGVAYSFSVTSVGAAGDIDFANSLSSVTPRAAPTAPRDVTALPGGGEAGLSWSAPTDSGGSAITDYLIQFSSDSGTVWTTFAHDPSTDPTLTVSGLNPSTPYIFRVAATNSSDTGPNSTASASITTYALGPDLALTPLARTADGFTFQLTLVGNGSGGGSIADYSITATSSITGGSVVRDGTTFTVKGLTPGTVSSVALSAARSGFATSRASISGTALLAGTVPVITGTTNTENGFTFNITNYGVSGTTYTYSISGPGSVVDDASGRVRLVGLAPGESAVLTVRANRYGYTTTSATVAGSVLKLGVPPVLSAAISARRSYSFVILDWVAGARYTLSSTVGATAVLETTTAGSEVTAKVTVSNLAYGASARTTVVIQRTGYSDASMDVVGTANAASSDATLSALALSTGAVDGFISSTPNYTVNVPFSTTSVQVRPTKNEFDAVIRYSVGSNTLATIESAALSPGLPLNVGSNTITLQVTAASGAVNTYLVRVVRAPSSNATLSALTTSAGSIGTFASDVISYVANVKYDTATVTVTPTLSDSNATMQIRINGGVATAISSAATSSALPLQVGNNSIQIVVTAQDGTTIQTYTLTVARGGPTKAQLSGLTVSPGTILNFDPATLNYEVNLPAGTATITITPTATADAFIWIRGVNVLSGTAATPVSLSPGITTIPILVTSGDLTVTTPYQVRVTLDSVPAATVVNRRSVGTTSDLVFTTQPQVTVVDSASQVVLLGTYTVRARISTGAGGTLIGNTSATTTRGVATFAGLGIRGTAGTQYVIAYEVDNLTADTQNVTVTPGSATQLVLVRSADGAQNAATFATQARVSIQDAQGNVVTSASDPITVAITAGVGGTLTGNASQVASSGVTTFAGLGMKGVAGRTYTLTYSSGSLTPRTQTIVVTPGAAVDLTLTRASSGLTSGDTFTVQPQVSVVDSGGNTVTGATGTITISLSGANGAVLDGVRTATIESGTATFAGLKLSGPGNQDYTLSYTLSGVGSVTEIVRLTPGAAHHIDLTRAAVGFYNGAAFTIQPEVTVYDKTNNPIPTLSGAVDASVSTGGTLVGLRSNNPVAGIASFINLGVSGTTGATYVVTFTYGSLVAVTQNVTVSAGASLTPTIGAIASTPAGFAFQIDNFTNLFRWDLRVSGGNSAAQLALSPTGLVSVSGLTVGSSASVSLATSRAGYLSGTATVTATALRPSIKPTFGSIIQTTTGFKVQIKNYDSSYTFSASASNGAFATVSSSGLVTVTGLVSGATSIATVTSSRTNYAAVSAQIAGSSSGSGGSVPTDLSANLASGKTVTPVCDGATSSLEGIANVNDQRSSTKFLCFLSADNTNTSYSRNSSGLIFSGMDASLITGIQFTSGDADASRDPMVFSLYGCNADSSVCRTLVANGRTGLSDARNVTANMQSFRNSTKFPTIKILFGSLRNSWTDAMQVAEVALVGTSAQASALVPTFGAITSNVAGYDVVISNFDGSLNWSGTGDAGTAVSVGSDGIAHVSGVRPGETATVSISASSTDRATGAASVTGGSLLTALIPVLGNTTATSDGFTASITNYSSLFTWVAGVDTGTASITPVDSTTALLRVAGQSGSGSVLTRVTTARTGYASGVSYIRSSTTYPGLMPLFGASVQSLVGFSVQLSNYDPEYTWAVSTSSGSATISNTGLVTVKGMASGATAVINVTTARTGYFEVLGSTTGYAAVGTAVTPRFGLTNSNATGFTVQISNFDTGFAWSGKGTNGETVTVSADGVVTVTGVTSLRTSLVTISAGKSGYVTGTAQVSATAVPQQTQSLAGSDVSISIPVSASTSVSDVTVKVDIPVDAAPASTVFTTTALATDGVDAGLRTITIKASNAGTLITDLNTPISITLPSASITGVPVYSPDGVQLVYIPQLTSLLLPDGQVMGYYRFSDGSIIIISRTL
ncbi:MAG: fibronectin type III domain-containing protein [Actinomycetes bacterium]